MSKKDFKIRWFADVFWSPIIRSLYRRPCDKRWFFVINEFFGVFYPNVVDGSTVLTSRQVLVMHGRGKQLPFCSTHGFITARYWATRVCETRSMNVIYMMSRRSSVHQLPRIVKRSVVSTTAFNHRVNWVPDHHHRLDSFTSTESGLSRWWKYYFTKKTLKLLTLFRLTVETVSYGWRWRHCKFFKP